MVNEKLKDYIETSIFPRYNECDKGHGLEHVQYVIGRSLRFAGSLPGTDLNIAYTVAAYHDLGCAFDRKTHEKISADIVRNDRKLREFFSKAEIMLIAEAVEDHRSSSGRTPRSIYGKIVATADKNTSLDQLIRRTHQYRMKLDPEMPMDQVIESSMEHIVEKFGPDGRARNSMYFDDKDFDKMVGEVAEIIRDPELFKLRYLKAIA